MKEFLHFCRIYFVPLGCSLIWIWLDGSISSFLRVLWRNSHNSQQMSSDMLLSSLWLVTPYVLCLGGGWRQWQSGWVRRYEAALFFFCTHTFRLLLLFAHYDIIRLLNVYLIISCRSMFFLTIFSIAHVSQMKPLVQTVMTRAFLPLLLRAHHHPPRHRLLPPMRKMKRKVSRLQRASHWIQWTSLQWTV